MFSKMHCFFPVVRTPLQKATCLGVGLGITGVSALCIRYTTSKCNKYYKENYANKDENENGTKPSKPAKNYVERPVLDTVMESLHYLVMCPFMKTRNPYGVAFSIPVTTLYTGAGIFGAMGWYKFLKNDYIDVKNTDQCCKLVRMSIAGTLKHSIFAVTFITGTYMLYDAYCTTFKNIYKIATKKTKSE